MYIYSALSLIFGIITIILAFYMKKTEIWNLQSHPANYSMGQFDWMKDVAKLKKIAFLLVVGFGCMSIIIGIIGIL